MCQEYKKYTKTVGIFKNSSMSMLDVFMCMNFTLKDHFYD